MDPTYGLGPRDGKCLMDKGTTLNPGRWRGQRMATVTRQLALGSALT